jgi:asparagine synthetase B (glutamine-hydrolysing)
VTASGQSRVGDFIAEFFFRDTAEQEKWMCGILVSVAPRDISACHDDLVGWIASRGPDSLQTHRIQLSGRDSKPPIEITFTSSVLHLRGHGVTVQPLISDTGDILCWNGEVWDGLEIREDEDDGVKLLAALTAGKPIWKVMEGVEGPWAMVYYSSKDMKLWFGRDCLGRRSLLQKRVVDSGTFVLSSVGVDLAGWTEVGVEGLWCLDLNGWSMQDQNEVFAEIASVDQRILPAWFHGC